LYRTGPRLLACAALAVLALAAPGCGGGSSDPPTADASAAAASRHRQPTPRQRCQAQLGGFIAAMDRLRQRLVVGVSYEQYIGELKAVRSYYEELPVGRLPVGCLTGAASLAEKSFNQYLEASDVWGDCVEVPGCQSVSIEAKLQRQWRRGAKLLLGAEGKLSAQ
jgi:hypothetical protein